MTGDELPPDLAALEQALRGLCQPGAALRERAMASVREELRGSERAEFWQYAAAVAAVFLVLLNLSVTVAAVSPPTPGLDRNTVATLRGQLDQMQLGLPADEVNRQCLLLWAGEQLVPYGRPRGSAGGMSESPDR
jgi:hypothetical protein